MLKENSFIDNEDYSIKYKEIEPIFELIEKKNLDLDYTFPLDNEKTEDGENIPGEAFWIKIKDGNQSVEAKLYRPKNESDSLLVFAPGMPGDSSTWFEEKHVKKLIEDGYTIIAVRHNGTKLNIEGENDYVHSEERIQKGLKNEQETLGEQKKYTLEETAKEYETILKIIAKKFKDIKIVGHSSGVLNLAYSLSNLPKEITDKIKNFVSLSGFIGKYDKEKDFFDLGSKFSPQELKNFYTYCNESLNLEDPNKSVEQAKLIKEKIYSHKYPENINFIQVTSDRDEYIPLESSKTFQDHLGRGLRVIDKTQKEGDFHDLKNLKPETLLRFLNMYHPTGKHSVEFTNKELKDNE